MSRSTQQKFFEALEAIAEKHGVEVINDRQWANTGTVRIERATEFTPLVRFYYGFQDTYAYFEGLQPPFGLPHLNGKAHPMVKPEELEKRILTPIAQILDGTWKR